MSLKYFMNIYDKNWYLRVLTVSQKTTLISIFNSSNMNIIISSIKCGKTSKILISRVYEFDICLFMSTHIYINKLQIKSESFSYQKIHLGYDSIFRLIYFRSFPV